MSKEGFSFWGCHCPLG